MKKKVDMEKLRVCEHCLEKLLANPSQKVFYNRILTNYQCNGNPVLLSNLLFLEEGFDSESIIHALEVKNYIKTIDTNQDILILPKTKRTSEGEILCSNSSLDCAKHIYLFEENNFNQLGNCLD